MKTSRLVLINPPTTDPSEKSLYFPMALVTLGGAVRDMGIMVDLWDFDLEFRKIGNSTEEGFVDLLKARVENSGASVFGISSICSNFPMAIWIAEKIKAIDPQAQVILGGPQPSSAPKMILERHSAIDVVVCGEGEHTLREMISAEFNPMNYSAIPGLCYREGGDIRMTAKRELSVDLDEIPYPDYSLINLAEYAFFEPDFYPHVEAGRGCPFHCTFCSTSMMWERSYRVRSPERILREMNWLQEQFGYSSFKLIHDNFTTSRKFVLDFSEYFARHNQRRLTWSVTSRTDCIDVPRLENMREAGLGGLFFGVESGSERMQAVIKKNLKLEALEPLLKYSAANNIFCTTAFILGFPEETEDDVNASILAGLRYKKFGAEKVYFSKLTALTGTQIYDSNNSKLNLITDNVSTSPNPYGLSAIQSMIQRDPELFSSFFHIPHPIFSEDRLLKLVQFCNYASNEMPHLLSLVLEVFDTDPLGVFDRWDRWSEPRSISYWDLRQYGAGDFRTDFKNFIEAEFMRPTHQASQTQSRIQATPS